MAIDFVRLQSDANYRSELENDDGRDGQQYRRMVREGTLPPLQPAAAPAAPPPVATNQDTLEASRQIQFDQAQQQLQSQLQQAGLDPSLQQAYLNTQQFYDPGLISSVGDSLPQDIQSIRSGTNNQFQLQDDASIPLSQLQDIYKGSGAEFQGISFQDWLNGPSSPYRVNADGTGAHYDPSKQTVFPDYNPAETGLNALIPNLLKGVAFGGIGAGLAGLAGLGPLAGTTAAADAAAAASVFPFDPTAPFGAVDALNAAASGAAGSAGAGSAGTGAANVTIPDVSEISAGMVKGAPGGINFADSFAPTLTDAAATGGVNFADSFLPTLTQGGAAAGANFGPLSSIGDMISGLSGGGSLISSGLGGVGSSLGSILGGGVSGMGALTDILQTVGNATGPLEFGTSTPGILDIIKNAISGNGGPAAPGAVSPLAKLLGLGEKGSSVLDLLGNLAGTGLGIWNAQQQADATEDLYDRFFGLGAPYRDQLAQLNADPSSFYQSDIVQGALQQGSDAMARSLSARVGNPIMNPTAMQEMQNYTTRGLLDAYNNRWNQLAGAGQLGVSQSAPLGMQAVNAQGDVGYTAGLGLKSVLGNQNNPMQQFMQKLGLT